MYLLTIKGSPIEIVLVKNSLREKIVSMLKTNPPPPDVFVSIDSSNRTHQAKNSNETKINLASNSTSSYTSTSHVLPTSSILAIVFGVLVVILLLVGLFTVFFYMQKARLREEREKLEVTTIDIKFIYTLPTFYSI